MDRETSLTQSFLARSLLWILETRSRSFRHQSFGTGSRTFEIEAKVRIADRLKRLANGHEGDTKPIGSGVRELRLHFGPGYRIYYIWQGKVLIILLNGGDKSTQARDVTTAKQLAKEAKDGIESPSL